MEKTKEKGNTKCNFELSLRLCDINLLICKNKCVLKTILKNLKINVYNK